MTVLTIERRTLAPKLLAIAAAVALAAGLAALFNFFFEGEKVAQIQEVIVGTGDFAAGPAIAFSLSLVIGVTMIVVPCSFPMIFSLSPVAEEAKTARGWLMTMSLFTLGLVLPMAAVGALVGGIGSGLSELFSENAKAIAVSLYSAVGLFALLYALGEFGVLRLPSLTTSATPGFISRLPHYRRSFMLGLVIGGGLGIGCPFPTYHALLGWTAAVGSVWYGAALLGVNAIGRALPLFVIGLLFFAGVRPQTVTNWLQERRQTVKLVNGVGLTIVGAFLLIFWGVVVGLGLGA